MPKQQRYMINMPAADSLCLASSSTDKVSSKSLL